MAWDSSATAPSGRAVVLDPLRQARRRFNPASLRLVDPTTGALVTTLKLRDEGTYEVLGRTGTVRFDPVPGFSGTSTVRYSVADLTGRRTVAALKVTVAAASPTGRPATTEPADTTTSTTAPVADPATSHPAAVTSSGSAVPAGGNVPSSPAGTTDVSVLAAGTAPATTAAAPTSHTPGPGRLARTGGSLATEAGVAGGLVALGAVLVGVFRPRPRRH